jgi:hypothetical protein
MGKTLDTFRKSTYKRDKSIIRLPPETIIADF